MISKQLDHHIGTFLRALTLEVTHALRRMVRTGLLAFLAVLVVGGVIVTLVILDLGKTPLRPLAELSYAVLVVAALSTGAAAAALHLSVATLRGIERAATSTMHEIDQIEGNAVRSLIGVAPHAADAPSAVASESSESSQQ
ncbi:MAG: hypothetical protein ABI068_16020 [Ktedonobacterales bacterium]